MTKPVITNRVTKGAALTYEELDTNFSNLQNATIGVTGDTGSITNNLNDSFTIAGGTGLTSSVSGTTLTLNLDNTAVTAGSYTSANITIDAQGRITAASNGSSGSGTINSGVSGALTHYPSAGTTLDDAKIIYSYDSGSQIVTLDSYPESLKIKGAALQLSAGGIDGSPVGVVINYGGIYTTATSNFQVDPGQANVIGSTTGGTQNYANNATVDFANFSGMIMINRQDASSGNVALWLCGGGVANKIGDSQANACGIIVGNGAVNGYTWTNNTGGTITVNFFSVKTRGSG